jgi:hypothetical protein
MPPNWSSFFKDIPWSAVLDGASSMVEGAKKLWGRMTTKPQEAPGAAPPSQKPEAPVSEQIAALEVRLQVLEKKTAELGQEAMSSFEVVRSLTEQHSQVVRAVDVLIARTRVLVRVSILLAVAVVALFVFVAIR